VFSCPAAAEQFISSAELQQQARLYQAEVQHAASSDTPVVGASELNRRWCSYSVITGVSSSTEPYFFTPDLLLLRCTDASTAAR